MRYTGLFSALLISMSVLLSACGGGSSDADEGMLTRTTMADDGTTMILDYTGAWDARYNLTRDDCRLVFDILVGVTDQLLIDQTGSTAKVEGLGTFLQTDAAMVDENNDLVATNIVNGDVFGNGDSCEFRASTTLQSDFDNPNEATAILSVTVQCASGFSCESQGIGSAERQERPEESLTFTDGSIFDFE